MNDVSAAAAPTTSSGTKTGSTVTPTRLSIPPATCRCSITRSRGVPSAVMRDASFAIAAFAPALLQTSMITAPTSLLCRMTGLLALTTSG
jgi:hypothetical protein